MKQTGTFLLILSLLFIGCKKEEKSFDTLLRGTWINTQVDNQPLETDETFVISFRPDNVQLYAKGFILDEENRSWQENSNYTYSLKGDRLTIEGVDVENHLFEMVFRIESLTHTTLTYSVISFSIDGTEYPDAKQYTFSKASGNYSESFVGIWYGRCTTVGAADVNYHYWEYLPDGSFHYYYQNEDQEWIKKSDNEGGYFLYGNLFVSNYSNDLLSGGTGKTFECWNFSITGNEMTWTALRRENQTITYQMERVESAPEVAQ